MTKTTTDKTARQTARELWNDPMVKSLLQEGFNEAEQYGCGWCLDCYVFATPGPWGKVGARHLLRGIVDRHAPFGVKNEEEFAYQVTEWLVEGFCQVLPACGHQGRDGQPSFCLANYELQIDDMRPGVERLKRSRSKMTGFFSLIDALRGVENPEKVEVGKDAVKE